MAITRSKTGSANTKGKSTSRKIRANYLTSSPGAESPVERATRKAMKRAVSNTDVEYEQGDLGRTRRQPVAPRSKRSASK